MDQPVIQAIGHTLALIAGIMISPIPLAGLLIVLSSSDGKAKSLIFAAGFFSALWIATFCLAWFGQELQAGHSGGRQGYSNWITIIHLGFGALLIVLSFVTLVKWLRAPSETDGPKWMQKIDSASMLTIYGMAVTLVLVNAKNLPLVISAATEFSRSNLSTDQLALAVTVFAILGSFLAFLPIILGLVAAKKAEKLFRELRPWLISYNGLILAVIFFLMGFHLLEKAML